LSERQNKAHRVIIFQHKTHIKDFNGREYRVLIICGIYLGSCFAAESVFVLFRIE
jgi:hypothetical protein